MFTTWYSAKVQKQMESGNNTDEIEVDLRLSVMKPACMPSGWWAFKITWQAVWESGNIAKGWSEAVISELVQGKTTLSPEDPYENIEAIII